MTPLRQLRRAMRGLRSYIRQAHEAASLDYNAVRTPRLILDFPAWAMSRRGRSLLEEGVPWINFSARAVLERRLQRTDRVFEFGAGGSTIFFARRVSEVTSIEYDPAWHDTITSALVSLGLRNWTYRLVPATSAGAAPVRAAYASAAEGFERMSFAAFASSIDAYPDGYFDWILIDGRARVGCFLHAHRKLVMGGHLILDDAQRDRYRTVHAATRAAGWPVKRYHGPGPRSDRFWETAVWTKTRDLEGVKPPS